METAKPSKVDRNQTKPVRLKKRENWESSLRDAKYSLNFLMRNQSHKYDHELLKKTFEDTSDDLSRASEEQESSGVLDVCLYG